MGWLIVKHSFSLVFRNFGYALRVSVGPVLIATALVYLMILITGFTPAWATTSLMLGRVPTSLVMVGLIAVLAYLIVATWIAVAWHRFILLEDYPGFLPALSVPTIMTYIGKSVVIGLLLFLALIPTSLVAGLGLAMLGLTQNALASLVLGFFLGLILTFVWLRLAIVLPGVAVAKPMGIRDAWTVTKPVSDDIISAAAILVAINTGVSVLVDFFLPVGWLYVGVMFVLSWITMMVGISLLTTLYGHLIEKRPLV